MPTRILAVFGMSFLPHQGRYLRVRNQLRSLASAGYDVTLLCWDRACREPEALMQDGFHVRRLRIPAPIGRGPRRNARPVWAFNRAVYRAVCALRPDRLHVFNLDAAPALAWAARRLRVPYVLDLCEPEYYALWPARYRFLLWGINALERAVARGAAQVFVHNGYQLAKFRAAGLTRVTQIGSYPNRAMLPAGPRADHADPFVIGRLGTIYADNGIEELLAAYQLLRERARQRGRPGRYRLVLAGNVLEAYRPTFERLVAPLRGDVEITGAFAAEDMPALYARLDLSLVLARRTRWFRHITPTKLFDSLAAGVPVVGSDIGEVGAILADGPCGVLADETDPLALCEAIERIADTPDRAAQLAARALDLARTRYTWEAQADRFLESYAEACSPPGGQAGCATARAARATPELTHGNG